MWILFLDGVLADSDGDGIPDDEDNCPNSDLSDTVVIDGCDSGVANTLLSDGCTIADLIADGTTDVDMRPYDPGRFGA